MLRTLLESQARPSRRAGGTMISIGVHTVLIALAIVGTARATAIIYDDFDVVQPLIMPPAPTRRPAPTREDANRPITGRHGFPIVRPVLIPPVSVPSRLPDIDLTRPLTDETLFDGKGGALVPSAPNGDDVAGPSGRIYPERLVEKVAAPLPGNPVPVYPSALRAAQIEGSVVARFVVDSVGRVEAASIAFPEATHAQFAEAVRRALLRSRYLPAFVGRRPVRQLVEQRFGFTLIR
jgi:TonB family protein